MQRDELKKKLILTVLNVTVNLNNNLIYSKQKIMKTAVVGATGMVGRTMMKVLEERNFPVSQLITCRFRTVGR